MVCLQSEEKPPFFDLTTLKSRTVQILLLSTSLSAFGINTPLIYIVSALINTPLVYTVSVLINTPLVCIVSVLINTPLVYIVSVLINTPLVYIVSALHIYHAMTRYGSV